MTKYTWPILLFAFTISGCNSNEGDSNYVVVNKFDYNIDGYVPDERTAIKIAEAILLPIYGASVLDQKPYVAKLLSDTVWIVEGTLKSGYDGGVAHIEIRKKDCTILKVTHGK